ncbi:MAG TPA: hypothetical protein VHK22_04145, partial [Gaiellaceae bacterium]|nr:hypothetical protein [Gaiellaceae bacterium]
MRARTWAPAAAVAALLLGGCGGEGEEAAAPGATTETATERAESEPQAEDRNGGGALRLERVADGLEAPVYLTWAPGEPERLYVVERVGRVRVAEGGRVRAEPFLDVSDEVQAGGEQGLLGLAFHPGY